MLESHNWVGLREILQLQKVSEYAAINIIQNKKHNEQEEFQRVCRAGSHSSPQPSAHQCRPRLSILCTAGAFCALSCSAHLQCSYCHLSDLSLSLNWSVLYAVFGLVSYFFFLSCGLEFPKTNRQKPYFWLGFNIDFLVISEIVLNILLLLCTMYLWKEYSTLIISKSKCQSSL